MIPPSERHPQSILGMVVGLVALFVTLVPGAPPASLSALRHLEETPETAPEDAPFVETLLAGKIVNEAGEALAGVRLLGRPDATPDATPSTATSDSTGAFVVRGLPGARVVLEAQLAGYETLTKAFALERGPVDDALLVLREAGGFVGRVLRPNGEGAGGADVVISGSGVWPPRRVVADGEGRFRWSGLPGGIYELRAQQGSFVSRPREGLSLEPGQELEVTIHLIAGASLVGRVFDAATEEPIAGAAVMVAEETLSMSSQVVTSGADGRFHAGGLLPVPHVVTVQASGYVRFGPSSVSPGGEISVPLERAAILEGIVVDERDKPIAGAQIEVIGEAALGGGVAGGFGRSLLAQQAQGPTLVEADGPLGVTLGGVPPIPLFGDSAIAPSASPSTGITSDAQGRFRLDGVPAGTVQLRVVHSPYAAAITAPLRVAPGEVREGIRVVLPDGGDIEGRVVDAAGYPIGSVIVSLSADREPTPRTIVAAEDGTFSFGGVLGDAVLTAMPLDAPAVRERTEVRGGQTVEVILALEGDLGILRGRVRDAEGSAVAGARVSLASLSARTPLERSTFTADDGSFEFGAVPPPPYELRVEHFDYAAAKEIVTTRDREARVTLARGGIVRGSLVDADSGLGVSGARVTLARGERTLRQLVTDSEGRFYADQVPIGGLRVSVNAPTHEPLSLERTLSASRFAEASLDLGELSLTPAGSVAGQLLDAVGEPVPDATLTLRGRGEALTATPNASGRFSFEQVGAGAYTLIAESPSAGASAPKELRVVAGEAPRPLELRMSGRYSASEEELGEGVTTGVAVELASDEDGVYITWVSPDSSAERDGLREDDYVLSVDNQDVSVASEARSLLRGPAGVTAVIEVERGGHLLHLRVSRESYHR